jgi:hypothetical protein
MTKPEFAELKLKLCSPDEKQLRIKMNKIVEDNFETDSITEMYHKLFVDMAIHGRNSNAKIISELLDVIEMQNNIITSALYYDWFSTTSMREKLSPRLSETESKLKQLIKGE